LRPITAHGCFALLNTYSSGYLREARALFAPPRPRLSLRRLWTRFHPIFASTLGAFIFIARRVTHAFNTSFRVGQARPHVTSTPGDAPANPSLSGNRSAPGSPPPSSPRACGPGVVGPLLPLRIPRVFTCLWLVLPLLHMFFTKSLSLSPTFPPHFPNLF
jgi:hypothetical protein